MAILSIQSHVAYGYVGNKAAVFPLQSMGYEVWPINTVQFSNHTGYGKWKGEIFSNSHIDQVVKGLEDLEKINECEAILSGYLGTHQIGVSILEYVERFKVKNPDLLYLCDPVVGDVGRGVFVKPEIVAFFQKHLRADIITPNHFEAEILAERTIQTIEDAQKVANYFHERGVKIVLITSLIVEETPTDKIYVFLSEEGSCLLGEAPLYDFPTALNGTGDLFSALFLGNYLKTRNSETALKKTLASMDAVMRETFNSQSRELKLLASDYRVSAIDKSIQIKTVTHSLPQLFESVE